MAEKTTTTVEEENARLKARIAELEATIHAGAHKSSKREEPDRQQDVRRVADSFSNTSRQKADIASRAIRGMALASFEGIHLFADTVSAFAGGVVDRGVQSDRRSVRDLTSQLPGDVVSSFSDAVDRLVDIPAKAAERYADTYRQGEKSTDPPPAHS